MEAEWNKVIGNGSGMVAKQLSEAEGVVGGNGFGGKWSSRCSGFKSLAEMLRKRKRSDACSACYSPCAGESALKYYSNFIKSSPPNRVLFFENSEWNDFPPYVVDSVREQFQLKNAAIELKYCGHHYLLDIIYMVQWDLKSGAKKHIAWIDEEGRSFFPEILLGATASGVAEACQTEVERDPGVLLQLPEDNQEIKLQLQIDIKGAPLYDFEGCVEESNSHAKRIKIRRKSSGCHEDLRNDHNLDQDDQASYVKPEEVDGVCQLKGEQMMVEVTPNYKLLEPTTVREIFYTGMKLHGWASLLEMTPCSGHLMQSRMELFAKQVEIIRNYRGDPDVRYAWLAANKDASSKLMIYGLGAGGFTTMSKDGSRVHLSPISDPHASAKHCAADEQGLQYLVLCRVILGNVEHVNPSSDQFHPTCQSFDNGVDDLQNPHVYIVWSMNASTHIFPEYLITFKMRLEAQGTLVGKETSTPILGKTTAEVPYGGCSLQPFPVATDGISQQCPDQEEMASQNRDANKGTSPAKVPKSPWMPFPLLFEALSKEVSAKDMEMVNTHYGLFTGKKITRDEFIKKLRSIVGDGLLRTTILSLQRKLPPGSCFNTKVPKQEQKC